MIFYLPPRAAILWRYFDMKDFATNLILMNKMAEERRNASFNR